MTTKYAQVLGIFEEEEALQINSSKQEFAWALVSFNAPIGSYSGADSLVIGGGGYDRGNATTDSLAVMIQKQRRDGKTVTIKSLMLARPGKQAGVAFYCSAITAGASPTIPVTQVDEATAIDALAGISDLPMQVLVRYNLA